MPKFRGDRKAAKAAKAEKAEARPRLGAPIEGPAEPDETPIPMACPDCRQPADAIRDSGEPVTVAGETVTPPGKVIGFQCTTESCRSFGVQKLVEEPEEVKEAKAKRKAAAEKEEKLAAKEEDNSDLPDSVQVALVAFGVKRTALLSHSTKLIKGATKKQDYEEAVIVTRGGQKLKYPDDVAKAATLTDAEKDGGARVEAPRFFPGGLAPRTGAIKG